MEIAMAKYREMEFGKPVPDWKEETFFTGAKQPDGSYSLAAGKLRLSLSPDERDKLINDWENFDNGSLAVG